MEAKKTSNRPRNDDHVLHVSQVYVTTSRFNPVGLQDVIGCPFFSSDKEVIPITNVIGRCCRLIDGTVYCISDEIGTPFIKYNPNKSSYITPSITRVIGTPYYKLNLIERKYYTLPITEVVGEPFINQQDNSICSITDIIGGRFKNEDGTTRSIVNVIGRAYKNGSIIDIIGPGFTNQDGTPRPITNIMEELIIVVLFLISLEMDLLIQIILLYLLQMLLVNRL